jgi:hypothetical protein
MDLREIRYKHMKQMDDQFCICGVETSGSATVAFVNVTEE